MAQSEDEKLALSIARGMTPIGGAEALGRGVSQAQSGIVDLLRSLGLIRQPAPALNEPLPRVDPATGNIIWPEQQMQIQPGDVVARRFQQMKAAGRK